MRTDFRRKPNRLSGFDYSTPNAYFVTICTADKRMIFNNSETVSESVERLKTSAERLGFQIIAYCFMPDHVHLLVDASESKCDLIKFIKRFKQKTGYEFKKKRGLTLWQRSFYDHILRSEESLIKKARYIFNNPVRKGLVEDFREYPFLGSRVFDIDEI
ncbi:MAG: transposase [Thermodesulfobacteriota bacterium]